MSKSIEFRVPKPCHENWQNMEPVEQGKFCGACQKTVVDFSMMSNQEILQHISGVSGNVCGRFNNDQLSTPVAISNPRKFSFTYVWNIILATTLLSLKANAQSPTVKGKVKVVQRPHMSKEQLMGTVAYSVIPKYVSGTVIDSSDNTPVAFAAIRIRHNDTMISADSSGNFKILTSTIDGNPAIEISAVGYQSKIISLEPANPQNVRRHIIRMEKQYLELPVVTLRAYAVSCERLEGSLEGRVGGMVSVQRVTLLEKWKDSISAVFTNNNLRVFPNPVIKGSIIHVKFDLREMDAYELQIINSNGQILKTEIVDIQIKNQVKQILIPANYAKGVYFVRIQKCGSKETYNKKFIVK